MTFTSEFARWFFYHKGKESMWQQPHHIGTGHCQLFLVIFILFYLRI
ncbi:hypothetical protein IFVP182_C2140018 [Vibrio parahaemolyticus]